MITQKTKGGDMNRMDPKRLRHSLSYCTFSELKENRRNSRLKGKFSRGKLFQ